MVLMKTLHADGLSPPLQPQAHSFLAFTMTLGETESPEGISQTPVPDSDSDWISD